jgi:hypothetical protein
MNLYEVGERNKELLLGLDKVRESIERGEIEGIAFILAKKNNAHDHYVYFGADVSLFTWIGSLESLKDKILGKLRFDED